MKRRRGMTLTEVLIVLGLMTAATMLINSQLAGTQQYFARFFQSTDTEETVLLLSNDLDQYFARGKSIAFQHFPTALYGSAAQAANKGFMLFGNGQLTLQADLRPCGSFDPASSVAANLSKVTMLCCGKKGDTNFDSSYCTKDPGLSVEIKSPPAQGNQVLSKTCYPNFSQFNVADVGFHNGRHAEMYYIDLLSRTASAAGNDGRVAGSERRLETFQALGNTGNAPVIFCQKTASKQ